MYLWSFDIAFRVVAMITDALVFVQLNFHIYFLIYSIKKKTTTTNLLLMTCLFYSCGFTAVVGFSLLYIYNFGLKAHSHLKAVILSGTLLNIN